MFSKKGEKMSEKIISNLAAEKILKKAGAKRVSSKAAEEFAKMLEHYALLLAKEIVDVSEHAGRMTIKEEDVRFIMLKKIKI